MNREQEYERFKHLNFEAFKALAKDESLEPHQKIGFASDFRKGYDPLILADILTKLGMDQTTGQVIVDIGCGCGELVFLLIGLCRQQGHRLVLIDSEEMLAQLPDEPHIVKIPGYFPEIPELASWTGMADHVLVYSVFHYVIEEGNLFRFVEESLALLKSEGRLLIGDIPNISKRNRFFSSPRGIAFHQAFMQTDGTPTVHHYQVETHKFDDGLLLGLLMRYRNFGFEAYLVPQLPQLPMANRREDLLIIKN